MSEPARAMSFNQSPASPDVLPATTRLYIVLLQKDGWMKRVFLEGKDSADARAALETAIHAIYAPAAPMSWPDFMTRAGSILRDAGFLRTAH
jgi:hypothetical protein